MYTITIVKKEKNPNYEQEKKTYDEERRYPGFTNCTSSPQIEIEIESNVLSCELTEEEFKAVKLECLKAFK